MKKYKPGLTAITVTRYRSRCFSLLTQYVKNQLTPPDQHIVVCDGGIDKYTFNPSMTVIHRTDPSPRHSINANYLEAIKHVKYDKICIMEDDDVYQEVFCDRQREELEHAELVGGRECHYYNAESRIFKTFQYDYTSLNQTAFTSSLIPLFKKCCDGDPYIDGRLWAAHKGLRKLYSPSWMVAMKSLWSDHPDHKGIGIGHTMNGFTNDWDGTILKLWIGKEYASNYIDV